MSAEVKEVTDGGDPAFEVSVNVTNTGSVAGKEVVQLYFRQSLSTIGLPVKRLIRFAKEEMGYYLNMEWTLEKGSYTFYVGSSSRSDDLQEWDVRIE
ncbi:glycoside hydrolase family 3 protein [Penicillium sp. IBT 35674x]|nr:glycoside hydrolase family 3 protein [Penicillium sp. IBT 35674x]